MTQEKEFTTTFKMDFTIADHFGIHAVQDTFNRAFEEWKHDYRYLTDLVMVLNDKCWEHHYYGRNNLSELYEKLYYQANDYALDTLKGEELSYFFDATD